MVCVRACVCVCVCVCCVCCVCAAAAFSAMAETKHYLSARTFFLLCTLEYRDGERERETLQRGPNSQLRVLETCHEERSVVLDGIRGTNRRRRWLFSSRHLVEISTTKLESVVDLC